MALDKDGRPTVTAKQLFQFLARDAGEQCGIGNLVAVEMQNRQHGSVSGRIKKLVGMPSRGQRAGLGLAIADPAGDDQIRIVEHRTERVAKRATQFTAFMD